MKTKRNYLCKIDLIPCAIILMVVFVWMSSSARAMEPMKPMGGNPHAMTMNQIKTQAEAEALKPGDSLSMACNSCKYVTLMTVGTGQEHIKMMTVGEKHTCPTCKGSVEVVTTGKGKGKNAEVKHVCSKCGDDAMFVCASKPDSGAMMNMDHGKK
jgi:hypothetical protein